MKNILTITSLILFFVICSCNNKPDNNQKESIKENTVSTDTSSNTFKVIKVEFDISNFKRLADSLLSFIQNKQLNFHLVIDTLQVSELNEQELKYSPTGYLVKNSTHCIRYNFDVDSPNKDLSIEIVLSLFNSTNLTDSVFSHLKYLANEDKVSDNGIPGLTYTNDYLFKQHSKIYWLNTGCRYSFENHKKYSGFLMRSMVEQTVNESIWCECGAVNCK
jgi:hypothetical protein